MSQSIASFSEIHMVSMSSDYFDLLEKRNLPFIVLHHDQHFKVGDCLLVESWDPTAKRYDDVIVKQLTITQVLTDSIPGIEKGYVALCVKRDTAS